MSGILLPLIRSSRATSQDPVAADEIVTFKKSIIPGIDNQSDLFAIVFALSADNQPKEITWKYADEADVDSDITSLNTLLTDVTT